MERASLGVDISSRSTGASRTERRGVEPTWRQLVEVFLRILELKDPYTYAHSRRVQAYMIHLMQVLNWGAAVRRCGSVAALLHDVGKITVDLTTLHSPNRPNPQQWEELTHHASNGAQMVAGFFPQEIELGVLHHHERVDGDLDAVLFPAYPLGLQGGHISCIGRAIAVVDAFDAMTTQRPYNVPVGKGRAVELLQNAQGSQFDAEIVAAFVGEVVPTITIVS